MAELVTTSDGIGVAVELAWPEGAGPFPLVFLCHGYGSPAGMNNFTNTSIVPRLLERRIASARFSFRGHAGSEGRIEDVNLTTGQADFDAVRELVSRQENVDHQRLGVLGGSYGGITTLLAISRHPALKAGVLKAPATDLVDARHYRFGEEAMREWQERGTYDFPYVERDIATPYSFVTDAESYDAYAIAESISQPVLIHHGDADEQVPVEQSRRLAKILPHARYVEVHGADHGFSKIEDARAFQDAATDFLTHHLGDE